MRELNLYIWMQENVLLGFRGGVQTHTPTSLHIIFEVDGEQRLRDTK
jgi:hypothetical protein